MILSSFFLLLCLSASVFGDQAVEASRYSQTGLRVKGGPQPPPSSQSGPSNSKRSTLQPLTPQNIIDAYDINWSETSGEGKIIAIVDAYGCSTCGADLDAFVSEFGLPACTTSNGCYHKISQTGTSDYPEDDSVSDWGLEAAMDLQAAHAMAPGAKKYLIVANSASNEDLYTAVKYAVHTLKANVVSMSWGGDEWSSAQSTYDSVFSSTSIGYFAATGDNGTNTGIWYPASSSKVIAVGGTSIYTNSGEFSSEVAWEGSGGGCSKYTTAISAQSSHSGYSSLACGGKKAIPDTSLLADPNSGLWVYYSGLYNGAHTCTAPNCWWYGGGTSLATPLLAARAAARDILWTPAAIYTGGYTFRDITSGSNGGHSAKVGDDLVTGVGSLLY